MGVAVMLLVFLLGPTVYAQLSGCPFSYMLEKFVHQINEFLGGENEMKIPGAIEGVTREQKKYKTAFTQDVYVPIFPRRPPIMLWPSVMNPAVTKEVAKNLRHREKNKEYLKIECDQELAVHDRISPIEMREIRSATYETHVTHVFGEESKFLKLIRELIEWLSAEALECGFFTMFKKEEKHINRYIAANRHPWIRALQELVYILITTIAVIHNKTNVFGSGLVYGSLNWIDNWNASYEHWYKYFPTALDYIETFVLNSFDIVMAWLFDHLAVHSVHSYRSYGSYGSQWALSNDSEIVCALESYYTIGGVDWEFLAEKDSPQPDMVKDMVKKMAGVFLECKVKGECKGPYEVDINIRVKDSDTFVNIPNTSCVFTCNKMMGERNSLYSLYSLKKIKKIKKIAYDHAHMTTAVAHELYCSTEVTEVTEVNGKLEITKQCYPLIVKKYIMERQYKICKSNHCKEPICISSDCKRPCCRVDRSRSRPHCDIVTMSMSVIANTTLQKDMTIFPDL